MPLVVSLHVGPRPLREAVGDRPPPRRRNCALGYRRFPRNQLEARLGELVEIRDHVEQTAQHHRVSSTSLATGRTRKRRAADRRAAVRVDSGHSSLERFRLYATREPRPRARPGSASGSPCVALARSRASSRRRLSSSSSLSARVPRRGTSTRLKCFQARARARCGTPPSLLTPFLTRGTSVCGSLVTGRCGRGVLIADGHVY
jgi:hypothetical protein